MKLSTHILFGFALTLWLLSFFTGVVSPTMLFYALLISSITNAFIDAVGHEGVKRSPVTHSVLGSIFVTLAVTLGLAYLGFSASPWLVLSVFFNCYIHYILDMMTMQGVQLLYPFTRKAYHISYVRYDDPYANATLAVVALTMIALWFMML